MKVPQCRAKFELANSELTRQKNLYKKDYSSKRDLDNAKMNYDIAEAELRLTEVNLQNTYLKSPITGMVIQKLAFPGNLIDPGQVAGTIAMPLRNAVGVLNALPRNLVNALDQIRKQKEEAAAA